MNTFTPTGEITAALDALVARIAGLGLPVTRDEGDLQPPGVLVGPPTITGLLTMRTLGLSVPVYAITDTPGRVGLEWCLEAAEAIRAELLEASSEPTIYTSPINPAGLPAYLVPVRVNIEQE
jgi:hypothetical protein